MDVNRLHRINRFVPDELVLRVERHVAVFVGQAAQRHSAAREQFHVHSERADRPGTAILLPLVCEPPVRCGGVDDIRGRAVQRTGACRSGKALRSRPVDTELGVERIRKVAVQGQPCDAAAGQRSVDLRGCRGRGCRAAALIEGRLPSRCAVPHVLHSGVVVE